MLRLLEYQLIWNIEQNRTLWMDTSSPLVIGDFTSKQRYCGWLGNWRWKPTQLTLQTGLCIFALINGKWFCLSRGNIFSGRRLHISFPAKDLSGQNKIPNCMVVLEWVKALIMLEVQVITDSETLMALLNHMLSTNQIPYKILSIYSNMWE